MKLNGIRTVIFPIVILMLASCTRYHINVDSISSGKYTKNSYGTSEQISFTPPISQWIDFEKTQGYFWRLSFTLSYFFVALIPFLRPFLPNRRNTAY